MRPSDRPLGMYSLYYVGTPLPTSAAEINPSIDLLDFQQDKSNRLTNFSSSHLIS